MSFITNFLSSSPTNPQEKQDHAMVMLKTLDQWLQKHSLELQNDQILLNAVNAAVKKIKNNSTFITEANTIQTLVSDIPPELKSSFEGILVEELNRTPTHPMYQSARNYSPSMSPSNYGPSSYGSSLSSYGSKPFGGRRRTRHRRRQRGGYSDNMPSYGSHAASVGGRRKRRRTRRRTRRRRHRRSNRH